MKLFKKFDTRMKKSKVLINNNTNYRLHDELAELTTKLNRSMEEVTKAFYVLAARGRDCAEAMQMVKDNPLVIDELVNEFDGIGSA